MTENEIRALLRGPSGTFSPIPVADRFWSKVALIPEHPCLEWIGAVGISGYGRIRVGGRLLRPHRVAWELERGPIPKGKIVCHTCDNPLCCRIEHLFIGTHDDNMRDMTVKGRHRNTIKTHCPSGHEYTSENTYHRPGGERACRTCNREQARARKARMSANCAIANGGESYS